MSISIRPVAIEDLERFQRAMGVPYFSDPSPEKTERIRENFEIDRLRAACDGREIVGTIGTLSLEMNVPGRRLRTAGTTVVSVLPTHRRQGIMRRMLQEHFQEAYEHGEPLAALWASEGCIYGRFGYGPASQRAVSEIAKPHARLQQPVDIAGAMRLIEVDEASRTFPQIYDVAGSQIPGTLRRDQNWWRGRVLGDPEFMRRGATAHRRVLYTRDGEPAAYAIYRTREQSTTFDVQLQVVELLGVDGAAEHAMWQYIFGVDLISGIQWANLPADAALPWWLIDGRRLQRHLQDALWMRPVDVVACLESRRYSISGILSFEFRDEFCPWNDGTYRLEVDSEGTARCTRQHGEASLQLTPFALGAAYLGGVRFTELARAGKLHGDSAALRAADLLFSWHRLPWCAEVF